MSKKETKTAGKRKQINVRLTDEEFKMMKEKSKNYPSLSTLVIDAVRSFDDRKGRNKIDTMIDFSNYIRQTEVEMARVGNNLNQVAHEINLYKFGDFELPSIEQLLKTLEESLELNKTILREIRRFGNKSRKI